MMLGFEITAGNEILNLGVVDCEAWILVNYMPSMGAVAAIGRWDFTAKTLDKWWHCKQMRPGDSLKIRFTEISEETPPVESEVHPSLKRRPSKLELFKLLERDMKNEGIDISKL